MLLNLRHRFQDELGDGTDLGGSGDGETIEESGEEVVEPQPWEEPLGSLHESVTAMEGRFGEQLSPLQTQLKEMQESLSKQTAVEIPDDKLAAIEALFAGYDPKFEGVGDLLRDLLTSSVKQTPLDETALRPHLDAFGGQLRYETASNWLNDVVSPGLSFDQDSLVNEADPQAPSTDLQRAWMQFWQTSTAAQRQALTAQTQEGFVANPREFGQAMLAFDQKWKKLSQDNKESAGASSRRLAGATQTSSSGRSTGGSSQLRSEADGWNSVFSKAS